MSDFEIVVRPENTQTILDWVTERGGVAVWESVNLSNPGASWFTPGDGEKPTWQAASKPSKVIIDVNNIGVVEYAEAERFHIATRLGSQGLSIKLTTGSSNRVWKKLDKWRDQMVDGFAQYVTYRFDGDEAVILIPTKVVPLAEY